MVIFLFCITSNVFCQDNQRSEIIKNIYRIRDSRDQSGVHLLISALKINDKDIVIRSLNALADVGDSNTVADITGLLNSSDDGDIQKMCAFALGQINVPASVVSLESALNSSAIRNNAKIEVLSSLGKIGNAASLEMVINLESNEPLINEAIAISIGRFTVRKITSINSIEKLKKLYNSDNESVRRNVAYSVFRTANPELLSLAKDEILLMIKDNDAMIRSWGYGAMGRFKDSTANKFVREFFTYPAIPSPFSTEVLIFNKRDKDARVEISKINGLGNIELNNFLRDSDGIRRVLEKYLDSTDGVVKFATLDAVGKIYSNSISKDPSIKGQAVIISEKLKRISLSDSEPVSIRSSALNNYAKIRGKDAKSLVLSVLPSDVSYDMKRAAVDACVNLKDSLIFKEIRDSITKIVERYNITNPNVTGEIIGSNDLAKLYRGYVSLLTNYINTPDVNDRNILRLIFGEFLSSKDAEIVANCIQALSDTAYVNNTAWNEEDKLIFDFEFKTLKMPQDFDVMTSFIDAAGDLKVTSLVPELVKLLSYPDLMIAKKSSEALKKLTGDDFPVNTAGLIDEERFNRGMSRMNEKYVAEINTNKGKIVMELFNDIAPMSASNFIDLAEKNYYDGTIFHRVVPNFVVQGGDGTGTGFGSPEYSIRSEFSPLTYSRGVVGMASSGKDTEGSQFFITHSPQFHLDGKYTIFGFVTEGMDVVDKIIVGDKIESVRIVKK